MQQQKLTISNQGKQVSNSHYAGRAAKHVAQPSHPAAGCLTETNLTQQLATCSAAATSGDTEMLACRHQHVGHPGLHSAENTAPLERISVSCSAQAGSTAAAPQILLPTTRLTLSLVQWKTTRKNFGSRGLAAIRKCSCNNCSSSADTALGSGCAVRAAPNL